MDLDTFIVATYCLVDEAMDESLGGERLRSRGPGTGIEVRCSQILARSPTLRPSGARGARPTNLQISSAAPKVVTANPVGAYMPESFARGTLRDIKM